MIMSPKFLGTYLTPLKKSLNSNSNYFVFRNQTAFHLTFCTFGGFAGVLKISRPLVLRQTFCRLLIRLDEKIEKVKKKLL